MLKIVLLPKGLQNIRKKSEQYYTGEKKKLQFTETLKG